MQIKSLLFSILTMMVFGVTHVDAEDLSKNIFVSDAWVQAMPPSQKNSAAYMTITNNSPKEAVLVSVSSDIAGAAEIHQMSTMNGMMNMAMLPALHIPAHGKLTLHPGGYHIMLINLKKPTIKGNIVYLTLHFQDGSDIIVKAQVKTIDYAKTN